LAGWTPDPPLGAQIRYLGHVERNHPMRIDVKCYAAPWENTTTDLDKAYDLAYNLSEEYQCDVDLRYNETGIIFTTVSNY
jgi:hypothetical protein